jgi:hypothetical protein
MKLMNANKIQDQRPSHEEIYAEIELGDSIRVVFDYEGEMILQLVLVESKDEESQTVTGIIDEDMPLDKRIVIEDELLTIHMRQVFGVMSNEPSFASMLGKLGIFEEA